LRELLRGRSLFEPIDEAGSRQLVDTIEDAADAVEDTVCNREAIASAMRTLDDRERLVIVRRFLASGPRATLSAIAVDLKCSVEGVRKIEQRALRKMACTLA